ncbi:LptM family lipoprotein [Enterococcus sp. AZ103]|uniref:LptM family lipoprotein n=1 Tax=Enterococcus sp. AZ103 TaxID=2774628 RepID=UPI003F2767BF
MKKIIGSILTLIAVFSLAACGRNISTADLKANDWIVESEKSDYPSMILSFSDHVITFSIDSNNMESSAKSEMESIGEEFAKSIIDEMNFKYEYTLDKNKLTWKSDDKDNSEDETYLVGSEGKNIILTPEKISDSSESEKMVLKPIEKNKQNKKESNDESDSSSKSEKKDNSLLKNNKKFSYLATNNGAEKTKIIDQKDYATNWSDSSWSGVNVSIDEVSILKVEDFKDYSDEEYPAFIMVHFNIDNTSRDVGIFPEYATLNTNTGEQTEGSYHMKSFAGDLFSGSKVNGYASFPLTNLENVTDINQIRLKFNSSYDTDDFNDDNAYHEYDATIDLQ